MVHASDANGLLTIAQTQPVSVVFAVPDVHLPKINKRMQAGEVLRVEAWNREQNVKLADGQVASTDNAIDVTTGTIKLKAQFANADNSLFPTSSSTCGCSSTPSATRWPCRAPPCCAAHRAATCTRSTATARSACGRCGRAPTTATWSACKASSSPASGSSPTAPTGCADGAQIEVIAAAGEAASAAKLASGASSGESPSWMSRLPPDVAERVKAMSPEERRAWIQKRREERGPRQSGGAPSN
jgi:multidrug efflux system membrane fusion protein